MVCPHIRTVVGGITAEHGKQGFPKPSGGVLLHRRGVSREQIPVVQKLCHSTLQLVCSLRLKPHHVAAPEVSVEKQSARGAVKGCGVRIEKILQMFFILDERHGHDDILRHRIQLQIGVCQQPYLRQYPRIAERPGVSFRPRPPRVVAAEVIPTYVA